MLHWWRAWRNPSKCLNWPNGWSAPTWRSHGGRSLWPCTGFIALQSDEVLKRYRIVLGVGRVKNVNKNLLAKKAIWELGSEIVRQKPVGLPITVGYGNRTSEFTDPSFRGFLLKNLDTKKAVYQRANSTGWHRTYIIPNNNRISNHLSCAKSTCSDKVTKLWWLCLKIVVTRCACC